jgi:hypothetical protein
MNLVTSSWSYPENVIDAFAPFHVYTSGIGISSLALPRNIQRTTGDIPALPTPVPFDFDEPVDLIIATDGSVLFGVGYQICNDIHLT